MTFNHPRNCARYLYVPTPHIRILLYIQKKQAYSRGEKREQAREKKKTRKRRDDTLQIVRMTGAAMSRRENEIEK